MLPSRARMRLALLIAPILLLAACADPAVPPLSYARCAAAGACGIGTRCEAVSLTTTGDTASLCTAGCVRDEECPGWSARCVPASDADGGAARCFHGCDATDDCRAGTVCLPLSRTADDGGAGSVGVCVPDFGPRPCARDSDCAPFAMRCLGEDGGVSGGERRCRAM